MNMKILLSTVSAVSLISFSTASATVLTAVYKGTVESGTDQIGLFGTAGENLTGDAYVARYTYDTANGFDDLPFVYEIDSFTPRGSVPSFNATLTINGITAYIPGSALGSMAYSPFSSNEIVHYVEDRYSNPYIYDGNGTVRVYNTITNIVYGLDNYGGNTVLPTTNIYGIGYALFAAYNFGNGGGGYQSTIYEVGIGLSGYGTLTIGTGSVPEPATWTLMLAGFGLVGATLRRRRLETSRA